MRIPEDVRAHRVPPRPPSARISTQSGDYAVETLEGHHGPDEKHDSFGDHTQNIVSGHHYKLDTLYATNGLTLHPQSQRAPVAMP